MLDGITFARSIPQPWATITLEGPRRFDNSDHPPYIGLLGKRVAIYAPPRPDTKTCDQAMELLAASGIPQSQSSKWVTRKIRGAIIGTAVVAGVVTVSDDPWFVGPYGIWLTEPEILATPIEMPGKSGHGFWRLP